MTFLCVPTPKLFFNIHVGILCTHILPLCLFFFLSETESDHVPEASLKLTILYSFLLRLQLYANTSNNSSHFINPSCIFGAGSHFVDQVGLGLAMWVKLISKLWSSSISLPSAEILKHTPQHPVSSCFSQDTLFVVIETESPVAWASLELAFSLG